jgi:hypothetical protein
MPWWGWVLIGVGVLAIGAIKLFFFGKIKAKAKDKAKHDETIEED